ncbi:allatotropins-like [Culex pipiens pallens]|uniref:allatotropins-like n=1 Tax=Culex pipiens pallens TaxID=42434 RepID=UPI001954F449|nr:allatotropins-like [Culex pipiens pallens]XP_039436164.1 allatotropins-like [Culex pipiens pallens]
MKIMKMSPCKVLFVVMLCSVLLCYHTSSAGPARQLASLAARASKIPRSIRAPFRNSEMMTARGFGKRRAPIGANVGGGSASGTMVKHVADETPWGYDKHEAGKLIEELVADGVDSLQMGGAGEQESFPLDWFASEMTTNPALARTILQRFVDTNRDGILTTSELISSPLGGGGAAASDSNDLF